jgi:hypothetical protein
VASRRQRANQSFPAACELEISSLEIVQRATPESYRRRGVSSYVPVSFVIIPPKSFIEHLQLPLVAVELASRDHFDFNARGPPHT